MAFQMNDRKITPLPIEDLTQREQEVLKLVVDGLSNREIAETLFLSIETVKWYNRQIFQKLNVKNRTQATIRANELDIFEPVRSVAQHNLPAVLTTFVGRQQELRAIKRLLSTSRLVTVTGVGGSGKTRLCIEVGRELAEQYRDGVYFVPISPVTDPKLVGNAIAEAVGIDWQIGTSIEDTLISAFDKKHMLLILDNFEHVLDAGALVSNLLADTSTIDFLITSREILHLYGEQEFPLEPLSLPDIDRPIPVASITQFDSVALLIDRLQVVKPTAAFSQDDYRAIAQICVMLDGLPLALELAAVRYKILTLPDIVNRLNDRLEFLRGGSRDLPDRQHTLRRTIDWSYELLKEDDQLLFANMAVFRGGATLNVIKAVCVPTWNHAQILDGLTSLVDKSLITTRVGLNGETRFWMLAIMRDYALERLENDGRLEKLCAAHAAYFLDLCEEGDRQQFEGDQTAWSHRIEVEYDNIRTALNWTILQKNAEMCARFIYTMAWWWGINKYAGEGYQFAERVLEMREAIPSALRGMMLRRIGRLVFLHGQYEQARELLEESVTLLRETDEQVELARALNQLSKLANNPELAQESLRIFTALDNKRGLAWVLNTLGEQARLAEDHEAALSYYEESLTLYETFKYHIMLASVYANLGDTVLTLGDVQRAKALFKAGLASANQINSSIKCAYNLAGLACVAVSLERYERAAHLVGFIDQLNVDIGVEFDPIDMRSLERYVAILKDKLSRQQYEIWYEQGRSITLEWAIEFALSDAAGIG